MAGGASENQKELDLSSVHAFDETVDWVRNEVVMGEERLGAIELNLTLSGGDNEDQSVQVSVFVNRKDAYVIGFRGSDGVYLLEDETQDFKRLLEEAKLVGNDEAVETIKGMGTDHRSFRTFRRTADGGVEGRTFALADLYASSCLSQFSSRNAGARHDQVRGALSLITCMTAECARSRMIADEFRNLYYHRRVQASDAMQAYDKARRISELAECFPNPRLADRVEKLAKRAQELESLFSSAASKAPGARGEFDRKEFVRKALTGNTRPELREPANRVSDIAKEFKLRGKTMTPEELVQLVTLCNDEKAVQGAQRGVFGPPVGRKPKG